MPQAITRSERLNPEVRALLEAMDAQGAPPLETLDRSRRGPAGWNR